MTRSPSGRRLAPLASRTAGTVAALLALAVVAGCAGHRGHHDHRARGPGAVAELKPAAGQSVRGTVAFHPQADGPVAVHARFSGLAPNSEHGFHVHDKGDCSAADFASAGGHFNPTAAPHGRPGPGSHAGDLPQLRADAMGNIDARFTVGGVSVGGSGPNDIVGRSVVLHASPDDFSSQPAGNSGPRIACGVIAAIGGGR